MKFLLFLLSRHWSISHPPKHLLFCSIDAPRLKRPYVWIPHITVKNFSFKTLSSVLGPKNRWKALKDENNQLWNQFNWKMLSNRVLNFDPESEPWLSCHEKCIQIVLKLQKGGIKGRAAEEWLNVAKTFTERLKKRWHPCNWYCESERSVFLEYINFSYFKAYLLCDESQSFPKSVIKVLLSYVKTTHKIIVKITQTSR